MGKLIMATTERKEITLNTSTMDVAVIMAEGNPGALNVIIELLKRGPDGIIYLLHLDDMNIRGSQIWIAFKYYCRHSVAELIECIVNRDEKMIDKVNELNQAQGDCWKATSGLASAGQRLKF